VEFSKEKKTFHQFAGERGAAALSGEKRGNRVPDTSVEERGRGKTAIAIGAKQRGKRKQPKKKGTLQWMGLLARGMVYTTEGGGGRRTHVGKRKAFLIRHTRKKNAEHSGHFSKEKRACVTSQGERGKTRGARIKGRGGGGK